MAAALHCEPERTVERRQLVLTKTPRLSFTQTYPSHADPTLHFVVERHRVTPKVEARGKRLQLFPRLVVDELARIETQPRLEKTLPAGYSVELPPNSGSDLLRRETWQRTPRPAPQLIYLLQSSAEPVLFRVHGFALDQSIRQYVPRCLLELLRDLGGDWLCLGFQVEAEVAALAFGQKSLVLARTTEDDLGGPQGCVSAYQVIRERGSFYARTGSTKAVSEKA